MDLEGIPDTRSQLDGDRLLDQEPRISESENQQDADESFLNSEPRVFEWSINESHENQPDDDPLLDSEFGISERSVTDSSENEQREKTSCMKRLLESYCNFVVKYPCVAFCKYTNITLQTC